MGTFCFPSTDIHHVFLHESSPTAWNNKNLLKMMFDRSAFTTWLRWNQIRAPLKTNLMHLIQCKSKCECALCWLQRYLSVRLPSPRLLLHSEDPDGERKWHLVRLLHPSEWTVAALRRKWEARRRRRQRGGEMEGGTHVRVGRATKTEDRRWKEMQSSWSKSLSAAVWLSSISAVSASKSWS